MSNANRLRDYSGSLVKGDSPRCGEMSKGSLEKGDSPRCGEMSKGSLEKGAGCEQREQTEGLKGIALFIQIPYAPKKSLRLALARPTSLYKGGISVSSFLAPLLRVTPRSAGRCRTATEGTGTG